MRGRWGTAKGAAACSVAVLLLVILPGSASASSTETSVAGPVPALEGGPSVVSGRSPGAATRSGICGGPDACWADGVSQQITPPNCNFTPGTGLATSYTGYWIADDLGYPATGDRYWGHVVASYGVLACLAATSIETLLPPNTQFAFNSSLPGNTGKIRCFLSYLGGNNPRTFDFTGQSGQNDSCFLQPGVGGFGNLLGYATMTTTLDEYTMFEIIFPMRSTAPLLGIANSNHKLRSRAGFNFDPVFSEAWVSVQRSVVRVSARRQGSQVVAAGTLTPASQVRSVNATGGTGTKMTVSFRGRKRGRTVSLGTRSVVPAASGAFSARFARRAGTSRCQVTANWAGVASATSQVAC